MKDSLEKNKVINNNVSIIDNNIIESPMFISSTKDVTSIRKLEEKSDVSVQVKKVFEMIKEDMDKSPENIDYRKLPAIYRVWTDSRGLKRELLVTWAIPDMKTMDVWNGLIGLYIQKISPIYYDKDESNYGVHIDEMDFTLYELAKFMNKSTGGKSLENLVKEIYRLKSATYYSFANGVIFDKKNDKYLKSKAKGKGFNLVVDCEFDSEKRVKGEKVKTKCRVQFNRLIIDNIRHEYFKYINPKEYFTLPSRGLTRRLYSYLKGNSHLPNGQKCKYVKRSFNVLRNKLPIYEYQPSKIKERLKTPLKYLIKYGLISDYFYGDEVKINGVKESCIYFIIDGTKEEIINRLTQKQLQLEIAVDVDLKDDESNEIEFKMDIPKDLLQALIALGVVKEIAERWLKEYDKWYLIKYIIWIQKQQFDKKKINPPALLTYALRSNEGNGYDISKTYFEIVEFVEQQKNLEEHSFDNIHQLYEEYMKKEIKKFKSEEEGTYEIFAMDIVAGLEHMTDQNILESKEYEEFSEKKEESELFKKHFYKQVRLYRGLISFGEYELNFREGRIK